MHSAPIVVIGEALVDLVIAPSADDTALAAIPLSATLGGAPFNVARTIGRLGAGVEFVGALSDDHFGRALRAALDADGVGSRFVVSTDAPTPVAIAEIDSGGAATYRFHTAATALTVFDPSMWSDAMVSAAMVVTGGLALSVDPIADALIELLTTTAGERSPLVIIDINHRPAAVRDPAVHRERIERAIAVADVIKASDDDLAGLWPDREFAEIIASSPPDRVRPWVITRGGDAVEIHLDGGCHRVEPPVVEVVDTIGAGDAFVAAFATWWSGSGRGRAQLDDRMALVAGVTAAVEVAALTCTRRGADPPWRSELGDDWGQ